MILSIELRQHCIIQVCGLLSKTFRQSVQIIGTHTDVWAPIVGHYNETRFMQGVSRELCDIALIQRFAGGAEQAAYLGAQGAGRVVVQIGTDLQ